MKLRCDSPRRGLLVLSALVTILLALLMLPAAAGASVSYSSQELAFLGLINEYRAVNGLGTLMLSDVISDASDKHNLDMGHYKFFDHTTRGSDYFAVGSSPWDRMAACDYDYNTAMGENIAAGYATAEAVFQGWKNSPGHDANMRNASFKVIGISLEVVQGSPYATYWTTDFGGYVDPSAHQAGTPPSTTTTTQADTSAPDVALVQPSQGAELAGNAAITVDAADDRGVTRVEIWIDGGSVARDTSAPYSFVWNTSQAANGTHNVEARAFDAAGNRGSASVAVTVANEQTTTTTVATTTTTVATTTGPPTTTTVVTTTTRPPTTTSTSMAPTTTTTVAAPVFTDVQPQDRFYREISTLAAASIIGGYSDKTFRPDNQVARAQFAKMIMLALGSHTEIVEGTGNPTFPDVPYEGSPYPFDFVEEAAALGIVKGSQDGTFNPYGSITQAQVALMLVRAGGDALDMPPAGYRLPFDDVPDYAADAIAVAYYNRLVSGQTDTTFDPYGAATRGQVAKMVYQLIARMRD